jgi:hypothetical protein
LWAFGLAGWQCYSLGLVLFGLVRLGVSHAGTLFPAIGRGGVWLLCLVTGSTAAQLQQVFFGAVVTVFVIAPLLGELMRRLPGQGGYLGFRLRALPMTVIDYLWSLLLRLLLGGGRLLIQLFFGNGKNRVKGTP